MAVYDVFILLACSTAVATGSWTVLRIPVEGVSQVQIAFTGCTAIADFTHFTEASGCQLRFQGCSAASNPLFKMYITNVISQL